MSAHAAIMLRCDPRASPLCTTFVVIAAADHAAARVGAAANDWSYDAATGVDACPRCTGGCACPWDRIVPAGAHPYRRERVPDDVRGSVVRNHRTGCRFGNYEPKHGP